MLSSMTMGQVKSLHGHVRELSRKNWSGQKNDLGKKKDLAGSLLAWSIVAVISDPGTNSFE